MQGWGLYPGGGGGYNRMYFWIFCLLVDGPILGGHITWGDL